MGIENFKDRVIEGDCLTVMAELPDQSINLILADLPYGVTDNSWDSIIPLDKLWEQYKRIIAPNGSIVLTGQGMFTGQLMMSCRDWFRYKIVWIKSQTTNFLNAGRQPLRRHEDICVFHAQDFVYNPQMVRGRPYAGGNPRIKGSDNYRAVKDTANGNPTGMRYPSDVQFFPEPESPDFLFCRTSGHLMEGALHATQKPIPLGRWLVRTFSNKGDIVLDNTCGSGTFLCAAVLEYRHFIGIEKNDSCTRMGEPIDYVKVCRDRIAHCYTNRNSLFNH